MDDIRLSDPVSQTGTAMSLDARLAASDVGNLSAAYTRQSGQFRQINQDPTYRATDALQIAGQSPARALPAHLVRAGDAAHGEPTRARTWTRSCSPEPTSGGMRWPGSASRSSWSTTYALTLRRSRPGTNWLTKGLLDPLAFTGAYTRGRAQTELSDASSSTYALGLNYQLSLRRRGFRLPLGGLVAAASSCAR